MLEYLKIIRPINLLIIAVTQGIIYYFLVWRVFESYDIYPAIDLKLFIFFTLDTVLLAAGGYVINDIVDQKADAINKPFKLYVNIKIKSSSAWLYFGILNVIGLAIATYIGTVVNRPVLILIFPFVVLLLSLYSYTLKNKPLVGNLFVSLFCAFVPGIIWLAEYDGLQILSRHNGSISQKIIFLLLSFSIFSFLANLIREIIKDLQDKKGDIIGNVKTLPIVIGDDRSRFLALSTSVFLLVLLLPWLSEIITMGIDYFKLISIIMLLFIPLIFIIIKIYRGRTTKSYGQVSNLLKVYMGVGLLTLIILSL